MATPTRRYDPFWSTFNADDLKKMSAVWSAGNKLLKAERIAYLIAVLNDPQQIDAALKRMLPHERIALDLVKFFGGTTNLAALGIAVRATGIVAETENYIRIYGTEAITKILQERGIVMPIDGNQYYSSLNEIRVFADDRVLARVKPPDYLPLSLQTVVQPSPSTFRRIPSVMLEVIAILRALDNIGGIGLTKVGEMRVNDVRKVARKLGWGEKIEIDGLTFPDPINAYLVSMAAGGLFDLKNAILVNANSIEQIVQSPATEIVHKLMQGILQTDAWLEVEVGFSRYMYTSSITTSRSAVLTALRCLPDRTAWYRFADFERSLFERIGEAYSIAGISSRPYSYNKTEAQQSIELDTWRQSIRKAWEKSDVPWIRTIFCTWLYAFGLIELHLVKGKVEHFRLTDLGRAILWDEPLQEQEHPGEIQTAAWIVQPNFEMVVYLGSALTEQFAFLEQYAERLQVAQHTAQYKLTRDSVYEGLQRGGSADHLIEGLLASSRVGVPDNVQFEIRNWATLRERITIRQHADLIEFSNETERRNAIAQGLQGLAVADRFLLLAENYKPAGKIPDIIDYSRDPDRRSLLLSEEGVITLGIDQANLQTLGGLDLWAERTGPSTWQLTRASVEQAVQSGRKLPALRAFLGDRIASSIPSLLLVALKAWTGAPAKASLSTVVLLQCAHLTTLEAVLESKALKPHLLGRIGADAILVKTPDVDAVKAVLEWAGVQVDTKLSGT
jgi:hypothetical protein